MKAEVEKAKQFAAQKKQYDSEIETKLIRAIEKEKDHVLEGLMNRYIINKCMHDKNGNSLIILATLKNSYNMVKMLLLKEMDANQQNHIGDTALHYACDNQNLRLVDLLLNHGAREDIENA